MSDKRMVVLSLVDEESARSLMRQLDAIAKLDDNVQIDDAAIAYKNRRGRAKLKQLKVLGRSGLTGAISSAFSGLASIYRDTGIDDDMMRRTAEDLSAGEVALFILFSGNWRRSRAVLQDALASHGIRYIDPRHRNPTLARIRATPDRRQTTPTPLQAGSSPAGVQPPVELQTEAADVDAQEPEPDFDDEDTDEFVNASETPADSPAPEVTAPASEAVSGDPVADATRAALIASAAEDARAADAQAYAEQVTELSELTASAGLVDEAQGEEMLGASRRAGDASTQIALLGLERKYGGLEIGRIAGELAQIGREVGERKLPILSALLADRSGALQRIAAEMVASAGTARDLASALEATAGKAAELGGAEVDEGKARLAAASALSAHAAEVGAASLGLSNHTENE